VAPAADPQMASAGAPDRQQTASAGLAPAVAAGPVAGPPVLQLVAVARQPCSTAASCFYVTVRKSENNLHLNHWVNFGNGINH